MIIIFNDNEFIEINDTNTNLIETSIWIDLISPTPQEEKLIEKILNLDVPTKKEMQEIEPSSRLYIEDEGLFMTATMVADSDTLDPKADAVTLILIPEKLITVRYIDPQSFKLFIARLSRTSKKTYTAQQLFVEFLEVTTDRLADILENVSHALDKISNNIFRSNRTEKTSGKLNYKEIFQTIGMNGELGTKIRESLITFMRLVLFFEQIYNSKLSEELASRLKIVHKDITALSDYAGFLSTKVNFLVEATLGMVNIDQNNIIKIFSVAAVIFLPPTLIASIYGMNFKYIPELHWFFGYPFSLCLMIISAWLPYKYFKKKKWL